MDNSQPLTKADLQEFAEGINQNLSDMKTEINAVKINTEEIQKDVKNLREDVDAFANNLVQHDKRITKLEKQVA